VKYEARALDERIAALNTEIEGERDALAVARAEWSLLNRPERIERLAKKYLDLAPVQPAQLVILDEVTEKDFARARKMVPPAETASASASTSKPAVLKTARR
jgi:cell division protein FtsL